jgi:acetyl-CoA C-acetyltransferase
MIPSDPTVILSAVRTPIGSFLGQFSSLSAVELGSTAIAAAVAKTAVQPQVIDEVLMGCVLTAGLGQAPARQAAIGAGLPNSISATTLNKMCGSGLKAVMLADDAIQAGRVQTVVAGGMESMTRAPYLMGKARQGYRYGHGVLVDHLANDGLEDAYDRGQPMGMFAEMTASELNFTRADQDAFAIESLVRAQAAQTQGHFADEIVPVSIVSRKQSTLIATDEQPLRADLAKIPTLRPAFKDDGTITAANASSISDGAAALVLSRRSAAKGQTVLASIVGQASFACAPDQFTLAPGGAIKQLLADLNWSVSEVDLWEINEAFAVVTMAAMQRLELAHDKVNVHGGACALGHPIGASGARILVTLIHALRHRGLSKGIAAICIGGGEAVALAVVV